MTLFATAFPLICFLIYPYVVTWVERWRPTLSTLMNRQRRHWVVNAVSRDTPLDAILSGNLMSSVSFFASTTVLLILALFAVFGQLGSLREAMLILRPEISGYDIELHLMSVLVMFVVAFLAFTLSLRQFNHFCIMLGAMKQDGTTSQSDMITVAALNTMGARSFNQGIRAYYFSIGSLAWFVSPLLSLLATIVIIGILVHREFFSVAHKLISSLEHQ